MKPGMTIFIIVQYLLLVASSAIAAENDSDLLKTNVKAPAFHAKDFNGKLLDLDQLIKDGPLVLVFLRGFG